MILIAALIAGIALLTIGASMWQRRATGTKEPQGGVAVIAALGMIAVVAAVLMIGWRA